MGSFYNMVDELFDKIAQFVLLVKLILPHFCRKSTAFQGPSYLMLYSTKSCIDICNSGNGQPSLYLQTSGEPYNLVAFHAKRPTSTQAQSVSPKHFIQITAKGHPQMGVAFNI